MTTACSGESPSLPPAAAPGKSSSTLEIEPSEVPEREPPARPVRAPSVSDETPAGLVDQVSVDETIGLAEEGWDRLAAENFAVSFAQLIVDTRKERDQLELLEELVSARLPQRIKGHLMLDYRIQTAIPSERRYDPDRAVWVRSSYGGDEQAPDTVEVEVAGVMTNSMTNSLTFTTTRVDVAWEDDQRRVIGFGGPSLQATVNGETADSRSNLAGDGWRELPR